METEMPLRVKIEGEGGGEKKSVKARAVKSEKVGTASVHVKADPGASASVKLEPLARAASIKQEPSTGVASIKQELPTRATSIKQEPSMHAKPDLEALRASAKQEPQLTPPILKPEKLGSVVAFRPYDATYVSLYLMSIPSQHQSLGQRRLFLSSLAPQPATSASSSTCSACNGTGLASTGMQEPERTVVYIDGSSLGNGTGPDARAGYAVYFGPGDARNVTERLPGPRQTNQRAELSVRLLSPLLPCFFFVFSPHASGLKQKALMLRMPVVAAVVKQKKKKKGGDKDAPGSWTQRGSGRGAEERLAVSPEIARGLAYLMVHFPPPVLPVLVLGAGRRMFAMPRAPTLPDREP
jgi:hypothetical protein